MSAGSLVRPGMSPAERCRYVADLIEAHPENFDMALWFLNETYDGDLYDEVMTEGFRPDLTTDCGTTCCIAGWAVAVSDPTEVTSDLAWIAAADLLGIPSEDEADRLFMDGTLGPADAAFLLRWHADELDRAS